jgi:NADH pyrophosphatase NudC (nudix superfamily)
VFKQSEDSVRLVYEYDKGLSEDTQIKVSDQELEDYKFVSTSEVIDNLSIYYKDFCSQYFAGK